MVVEDCQAAECAGMATGIARRWMGRQGVDALADMGNAALQLALPNVLRDKDRVGLFPGSTAWLSGDAPFSRTRRRVVEMGGAGLIWEGHRAEREARCCHIVKLHDLEALPASGEVACSPVKAHRARPAGPVRRQSCLKERPSSHEGRTTCVT